ncbi:MAG: hypothetical protein U1A72_08980 [Sulfuritalea sp.]|nr:hypothetical protein [Sulfuritalea sp.]
MTPHELLDLAIIPAFRLLPENMDSNAALAMCVAIAMQESRIQHRRQIGGPAHGYWQFEQGGGVRGVLTHPKSQPGIRTVLEALDYDPASDPAACYAAIEHNDILAAAFARLLLYTLPDTLPARNAPGVGWTQYQNAWRPGRPHRETFDAFFEQAWDIVS